MSATTPLASRPGAAPGRLSFGDSTAQAGARPLEIERAGSCVRMVAVRKDLPAHAISTKNKHLLAIYRSQPAVSRRLFRCLGAHLLRSPSIVKSGLAVLAPVSASDGQTPSVEHDRSFSPISVLRSVTSSRCRFVSHSLDPFVSLIGLFMGNKKTLLPSR